MADKLEAADLQIAKETNEPTPAWTEEFRIKFNSAVAQVFLLTGNVRDVVNNTMTLDHYLSTLLLTPVEDGRQYFDMIIFYDRSNGIHFALPEMRDKFVKELQGQVAVAPQSGTSAVFNRQAQGDLALPRDPIQALDRIEAFLKLERQDDNGLSKHTAFIMDYAQTMLPAGTMATLTPEDRQILVKVLNWARDQQISDNANPIFLVADSAAQINEAITASASRIEKLEILLPSPEDRKAFIDNLDRKERDKQREAKKPIKGLNYAKGFDSHQFAHLTAGLKKLNIEDVKLTAGKRGVPISAELVKARKKEIYEQEYQSQLEVIDPEYGFETVGGMDWLKEYLTLDVVEPMLTGDTGRVPMGLLFTGAAGTGKTILALALAYEAGINMVRMDVGKLMGSLVGQSEHNMARAMLAIRSLAPVLVFCDELDQSVNRGSTGDSGVSNRMFQSLLQNMSDTTLRGKVLWVGATNRPDMMDPALKRRGRFDKIIPFLPPDAKQRADIFPAVIRRYKYKTEGTLDFGDLATESEEWVGSDIEAGVVKAYQLARHDKRDKITQHDLASALKKIMPARHDVQHWTDLALIETSDIDLLPPSMREQFIKDRKKLEARVMKSRREMSRSERSEREDLI